MSNNKRKMLDGDSYTEDDNKTSKYFKNKPTQNNSETFSQNKTRLALKDYNKPGLVLSKYLLGKIIVFTDKKDNVLSGRIVETEAYVGITDKACHSFGNKRTERTKPMFMPAGTSYVYSIYGMYFCLNISSADEGGCVLIRALEPLQGLEAMRKNRSKKLKKEKKLLDHHLCSGPSKLCQAFNITKDSHNNIDMVSSESFFVLDDGTSYTESQVVVCKRIGIDGYGQETAALPYRFYVLGDKNVSVKNKDAEKSILSNG